MKFEAASERVDLVHEGCAYIYRALRDRREERLFPWDRGLFGAMRANQEAES
jgi:hypothetical protein